MRAEDTCGHIHGESYQRSDGAWSSVHRIYRVSDPNRTPDYSRIVLASEYRSACGWCWIGACHSLDAHRFKLGELE